MEKYQKIVFGCSLVLFIGIVVLLNIDVSGHKMQFEENRIIIKGHSMQVDDIVNVELLDDIFIGNKIKGTNTFTYNRGEYSLGNNTKGSVYVYNNSKPYIRITTKDKIVIYNDKNSEGTKDDYNKLIDLCNINPNKVNQNIIPNDSKYESKGYKKEYIIIFISISPLLGMGAYAFTKKTPIHFWAGSTVKSEEISDIKKYNRANGFMWIVYGLSFIVLPILSEKLGGVEVTFIYLFGFSALVLCYRYIYNKYKTK